MGSEDKSHFIIECVSKDTWDSHHVIYTLQIYG